MHTAFITPNKVTESTHTAMHTVVITPNEVTESTQTHQCTPW
jgi:hypothetical protein